MIPKHRGGRLINSFVRSFVRSFVYSFVLSFIRSFVRSFVYSFIHFTWSSLISLYTTSRIIRSFLFTPAYIHTIRLIVNHLSEDSFRHCSSTTYCLGTIENWQNELANYSLPPPPPPTTPHFSRGGGGKIMSGTMH